MTPSTSGAFGLLREGRFEVADEVDRVLDLEFRPGRERPVAEAQAASHDVEDGVELERGFVGPVSEEGDPARVTDDDVELVAVDHQKPAPVRRAVDDPVHDFDSAEIVIQIFACELVVVAGNVDDACALARLAQELLDDIVMRLWPEPAALETPAVDDVSDQIDRLGLRVSEEIEQHFRLRRLRSQMNVGNEKTTVSVGAVFGHRFTAPSAADDVAIADSHCG